MKPRFLSSASYVVSALLAGLCLATAPDLSAQRPSGSTPALSALDYIETRVLRGPYYMYLTLAAK